MGRMDYLGFNLPEEQKKDLQRMARARSVKADTRITVASLIRDALEAKYGLSGKGKKGK